MAPTLNLWVASLFATLTSSLFGYTVGLIGGLIVLPSFLRHFDLSTLPPSALAAAQSQVVTVWLVGAFFGVPIGIPVCARYGRKKCLMLSAVLYVLGAALQLGGSSLVMFEVGRAINGLGVGVGTLGGPMYISEISPAEDRGMLMSNYQTILQLSALAGFWGAFATNATLSDDSNLQWQLPVLVQLVPGALLLTGAFIIPETPQFLASQEKWSAVADSLAWLRKLPRDSSEILDEVHEVRVAAQLNKAMQNRQQVSFFKEAMKKPIRKRLGVGIGLMIAQNMVGLNALNYYAPVIFMSAGFTTVSSRLFLTGVFGLVKLVSAIAFMFVFVRMRGNRFWLKFGSATCGVSMLVLAYFVRESSKPDTTSDSASDPSSSLSIGGAISVLMVYIFAFAFGVSLGPISWNVCSEIFPLHINAKCCAITTCTQWLFQIVIAGITPRLIASVGWVTYLVYATACLTTYIWVSTSVPETRGIPLGKPMDALFTTGTSSAQKQKQRLSKRTSTGGNTDMNINTNTKAKAKVNATSKGYGASLRYGESTRQIPQVGEVEDLLDQDHDHDSDSVGNGDDEHETEHENGEMDTDGAEDEDEDDEEIDERTALIQRAKQQERERRRSSFAGFV